MAKKLKSNPSKLIARSIAVRSNVYDAVLKEAKKQRRTYSGMAHLLLEEILIDKGLVKR